MDYRPLKSLIFCMRRVLPIDTSCSRQFMSYARLPPFQRCSTTHVNSHPSIFAGNGNSAKSALSWHASGGLSILLNLVSWICLILPEFALCPAHLLASHIEPTYSSGKWAQEGLSLCLGLKRRDISVRWMGGGRIELRAIENARQMSVAEQLTAFKRILHGISNHCVLPRPLFFSVTKYPWRTLIPTLLWSIILHQREISQISSKYDVYRMS